MSQVQNQRADDEAWEQTQYSSHHVCSVTKGGPLSRWWGTVFFLLTSQQVTLERPLR